MRLTSTFKFNNALIQLRNTLIPFAQQNTETDTGVPPKAAEMGFNGQIGNVEDPSENRGVSGIQLKRSFYNIYFRKLTAVVPVLVDTLSSMYQFFIRDYCMNDRRYTDELKNYYKENDVSYTEDSGRFKHSQLDRNGVWQPLTLLHDRGKTVLGYPFVWPGTVPSWAIEIGTHETYDWEDYPALDNDMFRGFLTANADFGASYDENEFTAPDLRGISPAVWNTGAGAFLASNTGQHSHVWGNTSVSTDSQAPSHSHTGTWTHTTHNHTCAQRTFSCGGSGLKSLCGKNKNQSHAATTSYAGDHTHGVTVGNGTEKHTHKTGSYTPAVSTTPVGNNDTITRVNTYPVRLIVRVM